MFIDGRFNLAQLDPIASHLHLLIAATQVLQLSILLIPHHVACLVQTRACGAKRIRDELLRRQLRPLQITTRQPCAAKIQFTSHAKRRRLQPLVKQIGL